MSSAPRPPSSGRIGPALRAFREDVRDLWAPIAHVPRISADEAADPLRFYREYMAQSTPVVIEGLVRHWPAFKHWQDDNYLLRRAGASVITVDCTPGGLGDAVLACDTEGGPREALFVKPAETTMTFATFFTRLVRDHRARSAPKDAASEPSTGDSTPSEGAAGEAAGGGGAPATSSSSSLAPSSTVAPPWPVDERLHVPLARATLVSEVVPDSEPAETVVEAEARRPAPTTAVPPGVTYFSHQNDCLRTEMRALYEDVEYVLPLAAEACGPASLDVVNLWVGDERATSTTHKDHYDNFYAVVRGKKKFTLLPPSDVLYLQEREFASSRFRYNTERARWEVVRDGTRVPWIPVDPAFRDTAHFPLSRHATPVEVEVNPGDVLYLPALWYHRVAQEGITIAVNYWMDMKFGHAFIHYSLLSRLAPVLAHEADALGGDPLELEDEPSTTAAATATATAAATAAAAVTDPGAATASTTSVEAGTAIE